MENINNNEDIEVFYKHKFDFDNQYKETYDDWLRAFGIAIGRRAANGCFTGLSSGYDSGAITREMVNHGIDFKAYTVFNHENDDILKERLAYIPTCRVLAMGSGKWTKYYKFLKDKINDKALEDSACMATGYMFETAMDERRSVYISGQGGDEILSDYALFPRQSTFKGTFPKKLYEWPNFRKWMQEEYLRALEEVSAVYGIEIRYPFLDVDLVQEFLWLTPELKNKNYKAPLYEYLTNNNVPFERGVKRGFRPVK